MPCCCLSFSQAYENSYLNHYFFLYSTIFIKLTGLIPRGVFPEYIIYSGYQGLRTVMIEWGHEIRPNFSSCHTLILSNGYR